MKKVADELNTDLVKYKLDNVYRRAHFFGQIKQESPSLSGKEESFNYSPAGLISTFSGYYGKQPKEAEEDGRIDEIQKDGKKKIIQKANQEVIANKVYGKDGNAALGNDMVGDGWRYRGRGMHQTTGKYNYRAFTQSHQNIWDGLQVDFENYPEKLGVWPYNLRSEVSFWIEKKCYVLADNGVEDKDVDAVTNVINPGEINKNKKGNIKIKKIILF